jgi:hypothetical protein
MKLKSYVVRKLNIAIIDPMLYERLKCVLVYILNIARNDPLNSFSICRSARERIIDEYILVCLLNIAIIIPGRK